MPPHYLWWHHQAILKKLHVCTDPIAEFLAVITLGISDSPELWEVTKKI